METEEERKRFEAWVKRQGCSIVRDSNRHYIESMTRLWWKCWQAAIYTQECRAPNKWRDVGVHGFPENGEEVLFVLNDPKPRVVHGAFIGGIFWWENKKHVAVHWMPMPVVPAIIQPGYFLQSDQMQEQCEVCNDKGEIGGFVNAESGFESILCPNCLGDKEENKK